MMDDDDVSTDKYAFEVRINKEKGVARMTLMDGTQVGMVKKERDIELMFRYPKQKFVPIFLMQVDDEKREFISVSYEGCEVEALFEGMSKMLEILTEGDEDG